jgi:hypothetical protein
LKDPFLRRLPGMTYEGEFKPPAMGHSVAPIRVGGRGSLELGADGFVVRGYLAAGSLWVGLGVLFSILAFAVMSVVLMSKTGSTQVVGSAFSGSIGGLAIMATLRRARVGQRPVEHTIPYASIKAILGDGPRGTMIVCKAPPLKGSLHFHPEGGPEPVMLALRERMPR